VDDYDFQTDFQTPRRQKKKYKEAWDSVFNEAKAFVTNYAHNYRYPVRPPLQAGPSRLVAASTHPAPVVAQPQIARVLETESYVCEECGATDNLAGDIRICADCE